MMARSGKLCLKDIIDSIEKIENYTKDLPFNKFSHNKMAIDAVVRNLEIIGEASKNLPVSIKFLHKETPWKEMAGMRDKITHEYFGVDLDIIWKTIKDSLPNLKKTIKDILKNL